MIVSDRKSVLVPEDVGGGNSADDAAEDEGAADLAGRIGQAGVEPWRVRLLLHLLLNLVD